MFYFAPFSTIRIPLLEIHLTSLDSVETEVAELQGVQSVNADEVTKKVEISFDAPADEQKIKALLNEINYPAQGLITL